MTDHSKIITQIRACNDPALLNRWLRNAREKNASDVADAAFRQLISIVPAEEPGTVEYDFWQTINAFEQTLSDERGKTIRLSRTRQKVARVGVIETLKDWAVGSSRTEGFDMLLERGMPEYTGEAIVLRHPEAFTPEVRDAAKRRLDEAGVAPSVYST